MKGLILSGGKGTRLRPLTYTRAKQFLPLANKPVLFYAIEALLAAGICEIGIIVGDTHEEIEHAVGDGSRWGADVRITFIQQSAPLGLAHAVLTAREFLGDERFVMFLGDNLVGESLVPMVRAFSTPDCPYQCHILLSPVENPSAFGIAELAEDDGFPTRAKRHTATMVTSASLSGATTSSERIAGLTRTTTVGRLAVGTDMDAEPQPLRVKCLVEKPKEPKSNLALVGIYCFDASIFTAASSIAPSARGELEITDAIQWLVDHQYDVRAQALQGYWIDTGTIEDILEANRQVLLDLVPHVDATAHVAADAILQGTVTVQAGACIENSVIRGPAIIGERAVIRNAYIGPFTSIYHDSTIAGSEVEYSIVLEHSTVRDVRGRIDESLIGRFCEVTTLPLKPRGHKLMLGDHSRVGVLRSE